MNMRILMEKLIRITRSIGVESDTTLLSYLVDTENYVLQMQKEMAEFSRRESTAARYVLPSSCPQLGGSGRCPAFTATQPRGAASRLSRR